jgi:hypothetical protein
MWWRTRGGLNGGNRTPCLAVRSRKVRRRESSSTTTSQLSSAESRSQHQVLRRWPLTPAPAVLDPKAPEVPTALGRSSRSGPVPGSSSVHGQWPQKHPQSPLRCTRGEGPGTDRRRVGGESTWPVLRGHSAVALRRGGTIAGSPRAAEGGESATNAVRRTRGPTHRHVVIAGVTEDYSLAVEGEPVRGELEPRGSEPARSLRRTQEWVACPRRPGTAAGSERLDSLGRMPVRPRAISREPCHKPARASLTAQADIQTMRREGRRRT